MYHPRLYGNYYDMGLQYGRLLYEKANFKLPEITQEKIEFGLLSYELLHKYYPLVIEEIEGFAKGIRDKPEKVGSFLLSLGVFNSQGQCSVFAYRNNDSVIVGRNYDMLFNFRNFTESSLIAPKGKYAYISQSDVFIGRSDGINEKGLFVAMSFVNSTRIQPGISFHFIVRKVLEECSSTNEAVNMIQRATACSATNFLVADQSGDIAVVESAPQESMIRRPNNGENYLFITNQFHIEKMKLYDQGGVEWSKSLERYNGIHRNLQDINQMDLSKAKQILSDKCVCLYLKRERFGTIWSVVANLNDLKIERSEVKPKITNYKPETRLLWWLKKRKVQ
jgi:predicted choloylglycine hydrolase